MSKFVKELMAEDLQKRFDGLTEFLVITTIGVGGNDNNEMRGALLEKGIKVSVVKNSVMRKALAALEKIEASELFAAGPCAVAHGGDSVVDVAKEVEAWTKKLTTIEIKGAYIDGDVLGADAAKELSKMLSRAELQGQVVVLAARLDGRLPEPYQGREVILPAVSKRLLKTLKKKKLPKSRGKIKRNIKKLMWLPR